MSNKAAARPRTGEASDVGQEDIGAKQFSMSDRDFEQIRAVIKDLTGINMSDSKRQLVYRRLSARLKATGIGTFQGYLDYLKQGDPAELEQFTNAVTTNLTSFFRENHHFEFLQKTVIPEAVTRSTRGDRRLRIWSAGCSTGEEPYSIAITLRESLKDLKNWDAKVLCTDLDSDVINTCKAGVYSMQRVEKLSRERLRRWFMKSRGLDGEVVKVNEQLRELLTFKQLNLMHDWPMKGPFHLIFCRNVIIYFDKPTQRVLIDRYADILVDGGYLILGHSESLFNVSDRFKLIGNTIYRKTH